MIGLLPKDKRRLAGRAKMRTYGRTEKWVIAEETSLFKIVVKTSVLKQAYGFFEKPSPFKEGHGEQLNVWSSQPFCLIHLPPPAWLPRCRMCSPSPRRPPSGQTGRSLLWFRPGQGRIFRHKATSTSVRTYSVFSLYKLCLGAIIALQSTCFNIPSAAPWYLIRFRSYREQYF